MKKIKEERNRFLIAGVSLQQNVITRPQLNFKGGFLRPAAQKNTAGKQAASRPRFESQPATHALTQLTHTQAASVVCCTLVGTRNRSVPQTRNSYFSGAVLVGRTGEASQPVSRVKTVSADEAAGAMPVGAKQALSQLEAKEPEVTVPRQPQ